MSETQSPDEWLDDLLFKHGPQRGKLLAAQDLLTDLDTLIAAHTAYCPISPAARGPRTDLSHARATLAKIKTLLAALGEDRQHA